MLPSFIFESKVQFLLLKSQVFKMIWVIVSGRGEFDTEIVSEFPKIKVKSNIKIIAGIHVHFSAKPLFSLFLLLLFSSPPQWQ